MKFSGAGLEDFSFILLQSIIAPQGSFFAMAIAPIPMHPISRGIPFVSENFSFILLQSTWPPRRPFFATA